MVMILFNIIVNMAKEVAVYLKKNINWSRRFDIENENIENICIEINISKSKNVLIAVYYRPPNTSRFLPKNFVENLNDVLQCATDKQKEVILMGDFNVNYSSKSDNKDIKESLSLY